MESNCLIRRARRDDLPALVALERLSFSDPWSEAQLRYTINQPSSVALIAELDNDVVGYALGRAVVDQGELLSITTAPDRRGQGIGRQLLIAMLDDLRARGAQAVWLEVRESNAIARALYASAGFADAGRRARYYKQPVEDALVLCCAFRSSALRDPEDAS